VGPGYGSAGRGVLCTLVLQICRSVDIAARTRGLFPDKKNNDYFYFDPKHIIKINPKKKNQ
jgi:hypothetical protein